MFCYVKFVEGSHLGKKYVLETEKIQYKFKDDSFDLTKKYLAEHKDGSIYKCQILMRAATKEKLQSLIDNSKRVCVMPFSQLLTASESEENINIEKSVSTSSLDNQEIIENKKKLAIYIEKIEKNTIPTKKSNITQDDESVPSEGEQETNNEQSIKLCEVKKIKQEKRLSSYAKTVGLKTADVHEILQSTNSDNNNENLIESDSTKTTTIVDHPNGSDDEFQPTERKQKPALVKSIKESEKAIKISSITPVHSIADCEQQIKKMKKEIKQLTMENAQLNKEKTKKIESLKKSLSEAKKESEDYKELNKELQRIIIEKTDEKSNSLYVSWMTQRGGQKLALKRLYRSCFVYIT